MTGRDCTASIEIAIDLPQSVSRFLEQRVVATSTCSQHAHVGGRRAHRLFSLVFPRFDPKGQPTCIAIDDDAAEPLENRVGKRILLCRLAFDFAFVLHAAGSLDDIGRGIRNGPVLQLKANPKSRVARFWPWQDLRRYAERECSGSVQGKLLIYRLPFVAVSC